MTRYILHNGNVQVLCKAGIKERRWVKRLSVQMPTAACSQCVLFAVWVALFAHEYSQFLYFHIPALRYHGDSACGDRRALFIVGRGGEGKGGRGEEEGGACGLKSHCAKFNCANLVMAKNFLYGMYGTYVYPVYKYTHTQI